MKKEKRYIEKVKKTVATLIDSDFYKTEMNIITKEEIENFDSLSFEEYYEQIWIQEILEDLDEEEGKHLMNTLKIYLSIDKRKEKDVEHFIKNMFN